MRAADYLRVEKAIQYLEENYRDQPDLGQVAERVGLSEYHFQRLFRRWAGVSPKRFLQFLTAEHARRMLEESSTVLEAAYAAGLSGPGRLHDLMVSLYALTPGEIRTGGAGVVIHHGVHGTPFGRALLAATERGVCALSFIDEERGIDAALADLRERWPGADLQEDPARTESYAERIFGASGAESATPLPLVVRGTNFQVKVWEALLELETGEVTTYERLAESVGAPRAVRAVGTAVGRNPIAFLIPCHRVIRKSGAFGQYRWGASRKRAMLGWESARTLGEPAEV
jgi:AraC family transcriptional regulator, regulatory protein of adaptative response / methylated-DNA-[protein]-cysteine methyltransferase